MKNIIILALALFLLAANAVCQSPGKITLDKDFYSSLKKLHGNDLLKSELVLDIWHVEYVSVLITVDGAKVPITRIYLKEKTYPSIKLSEELTADKATLKFIVPKLPTKGDFVFVYSLGADPKEFKTVKLDHNANDGSKRTNVEYQSNVAQKANIQNRKWGMVSIDRSTKNHKLAVFSSREVVQFGVASWIKEKIVEPIKDGAELAWEGTNSLSCFFVREADILVKFATFSLTLVKDDGVIIPRNREMTFLEYNWANEKIFNGNLPPREKIIISNLLGQDRRAFVFPACGKLTMHLGAKGFKNAIKWTGPGYPIEGQIFIHELTHAWQIKNVDNLEFVATSLDDQKNVPANILYSFQCGQDWKSYKFEQQAKAVENCYINRERKIPAFCEEKYIVDNIRKGVPFRTPECVKLLADIDKIKDKITARTKKIKEDYLKSIGETIATHADGTPKVGSEKGLDNVHLPSGTLANDSILKSLNVELKQLEQKKKTIKCS